MGPRLALTPPVPEILQTVPSSVQIMCLHVSRDESMLYCAVLKGQQSSAAPAAAKAKPGKQGEALADRDGSPCVDDTEHAVVQSRWQTVHLLGYRNELMCVGMQI